MSPNIKKKKRKKKKNRSSRFINRAHLKQMLTKTALEVNLWDYLIDYNKKINGNVQIKTKT